MVIFHGGCHGCLRQDRLGVDSCFDCQYFDAEWYKPDLSEKPQTEADKVRREVRSRREVRFSRKSGFYNNPFSKRAL